MNTVILGGTHQVNDYNTNVDVDDRKFIYDGCMKINPAIKGAEIVLEKVGLRPGRNRVRLERDIFNTSKTFSSMNDLEVWLNCMLSLIQRMFFFFYREWKTASYYS